MGVDGDGPSAGAAASGAAGESSAPLVAALKMLSAGASAASPKAAERAREAAARLVIAEIKSWARALARKKYGSKLGAMAKEQSNALVDGAVQEIVEAILPGGGVLRGATDGKARSFLRSGFLNKLSKLLDKRESERRAADLVAVQSGFVLPLAEPVTESDGEDENDGDQPVRERLVGWIAFGRSVVQAGRAARGAPADVSALWIALGHRVGATCNEQLGMVSSKRAAGGIARLYKIRSRGNSVLQRACKAMAASSIRGGAPPAKRSATVLAESAQCGARRLTAAADEETVAVTLRIAKRLHEELKERARAEGRSVEKRSPARVNVTS